MGSMKGAAGGAMSGASMGATLGPWGALAGGIIGGGLGYFSGDDGQADRYQAIVDEYKRNHDTSQYGAQQQKLISDLEQQAAGRGVSLAAQQTKASMSQNAANAASLVQSGRGNAGAMAFNAQSQLGTTNAQIAQAGALARAQEAMRAQELRGMNITQARNDDESYYRTLAQLSGNSAAAAGQPSRSDAMLASGIQMAGTAAANYAQSQANKPAAAPAEPYQSVNGVNDSVQLQTSMGPQNDEERRREQEYAARYAAGGMGASAAPTSTQGYYSPGSTLNARLAGSLPGRGF